MPRILLLGGHGKVSLLLTPKLLARSWDVTSVIRNPDQKEAIYEAGKKASAQQGGKQLGKLDVLVESLEDVKSEGDAKRILEESKAEWVVWSAGAGGKGGPSRTNAIDRDACISFVRASIASPTIKKFLLVSALSSRRERAPWWDDDSWGLVKKMNEEALKHYYKAKLDADEELTVLGEGRVAAEKAKGTGSGSDAFGYIILRPGGLSDDAETGRVSLGTTKARGFVSRGDVADAAARLLEAKRDGGVVKGWFDLLGGEEEIGEAVDRVVKEGSDSRDGEDWEGMKARVGA